MNHYVYEIINNINGMKYIGKRSCHCEIENDGYMGGGKVLKKAKEEFGIENFSKKILAIADDAEMALDLESYYIERRNAVDSKEYYNQVYGGDISHMFKHKDIGKQERVRQIIAEKNKGSNAGENSKVAKKVICLNTGEVFLSSSDASKKYGLHRGSVGRACNPNNETKSAGRHPETGEYLKWMFYDEYIALSKGETYEYKPESKPKRTCGKPIICLNTLEVFNTIKLGAKRFNITCSSNISRACKTGIASGNDPETGEPLRWMYYDDYIKTNKENMNNE